MTPLMWIGVALVVCVVLYLARKALWAVCEGIVEVLCAIFD